MATSICPESRIAIAERRAPKAAGNRSTALAMASRTATARTRQDPSPVRACKRRHSSVIKETPEG
jgi:hypothetical protein